MSHEVAYRQCELRRQSDGVVDVAWIPTMFAKQGKLITIGKDERVWTVAQVYATTLSGEDMQERRSTQKRFAEVLGG